MTVHGLLPLLAQLAPYRDLREAVRHAAPPQGRSVALLRAARPFVLAGLQADAPRPLVLVCARVETARALAEQLRQWSATPDALLTFPEPGPLPFEYAAWNDETRAARLRTLAALARLHDARDPDVPLPVIITSARALVQKTLPRREFASASRTLRLGQQVVLDKLLAHWVGVGYAPATVVEAPGTFSRRGGILDIFPPTLAYAVRIEFFGDEVDSLRLFDPTTQRSHATLEHVVIPPAREALPRALERLPAAALAPEDAARASGVLAGGTQSAFPTLEFYLPLLYSQPASLLDYLPPDGLVVVDDLPDLHATARELATQGEAQRQDWLAQLSADAPDADAPAASPPAFPLPVFTADELDAALALRARILFTLNAPDAAHDSAVAEDDFTAAFVPGPHFGGQLKPALDYLRAAYARHERLIVASRQAERLAELWTEQEFALAASTTLTDLPARGTLSFLTGALAEGFILRGGGPGSRDPEAALLHMLTDAEWFGWFRPDPRRRPPPRATAPEAFFADLRPGDFIVHLEHGIGRFGGLVRRTVDGTEREYLRVEYANGDTLYVPSHHADRLSKYIGGDARPPALHRLGTAEWSQVRQRAQRAVQDIADDLLALYGARAAAAGHPFPADTTWQHELESAFPYIETEDQLRAIVAVKRDMEQARPMDRLICGDVGYGKTEVALRAAFKAIQDGRQVAVLVPTTVLAQQHFNTFSERLRAFPVVVDMLSRFRSRAEQHVLIGKLAAGTVDIVIGTHRLLGNDVQFKSLGLLIIDEEQRFGVMHKERLKQLRTEVDVLTLTATPIPRTLYMGLVGARDISMIETAPDERLPVQTHLGEYSDRLVRQAILRELDRGGQVFYVHNRVQGIEELALRLRTLVPEVRLAIAHGQMEEDQLERVMVTFSHGESDVLLCTSIIESGLDIPNANTLIIDHADWFGLAQLYQLRGRVGRGAVRAYAYLLYDTESRLSDDARQRLSAIVEARELGAGYSIAMRDLELRGAGDLLGARQSGHVSAVGFDLYTRLLARAVHDKRVASGLPIPPDAPAPPAEPPPPVTIDLPFDVLIPPIYVPDQGLRLQLYRRLAAISAPTALDALSAELADRFGPLPDAVQNLLYQLRVKLLAGHAGVEAIGVEDNQIALRLPELPIEVRVRLQRRLGPTVRVSKTHIWLGSNLDPLVWMAELVRVLEVLYQHPPHKLVTN